MVTVFCFGLVWLGYGLSSQSTILQSYRDGVTASWAKIPAPWGAYNDPFSRTLIT